MRSVALLVLLGTLAGCATLPTSGPVLVGGPISVEDVTEVEYLPAGPAEGASQREILDGFLAACAAPQNNFRIARLFLTDAVAQSWNPARMTLVRGIYSSVNVKSNLELVLATTVDAQVDESGVYTESTGTRPLRLSFGFTQVGNEWRLSQVPDLSIVTEVAFDAAYDEYIAYFLNQARTELIPDVRFFARQGDPVTAVTRAVIGGPSPFLTNASTAFPPETSLQSAPVVVSDGRALVDVSESAGTVSVDDQRAMLAQLQASLTEFTEITSTALSVDQIPVPIAPLSIGELDPRVDDRPLVVVDGKLGHIAEETIEPLRTLGARIVNLEPIAVSYDASSDIAAVGTRLGVYRVSNRTDRVSQRPSLVDPQIDDAQTVWWVDPQTPSLVSAFVAGAEVTFRGPWPETASIASLEISRENARIAIAVNLDSTAQLFVAAISVDDDGRPVTIDGYRELPVDTDRIIDLAWVDSTNIAVVGVRDRVSHVEAASVGGRSFIVGQPQNPERISGGNTGTAGLVVLSTIEQLWRPRGSGWQSTGWTVDLLATQR